MEVSSQKIPWYNIEFCDIVKRISKRHLYTYIQFFELVEVVSLIDTFNLNLVFLIIYYGFD